MYYIERFLNCVSKNETDKANKFFCEYVSQNSTSLTDIKTYFDLYSDYIDVNECFALCCRDTESIDKAIYFFNMGADINDCDSFAMLCAIETRNDDLITFLLDNNINVMDDCILYKAIEHKKTNVIERILSNGFLTKDYHIKKAIKDRHVDVIRLFINHGIDANRILKLLLLCDDDKKTDFINILQLLNNSNVDFGYVVNSLI